VKLKQAKNVGYFFIKMPQSEQSPIGNPVIFKQLPKENKHLVTPTVFLTLPKFFWTHAKTEYFCLSSERPFTYTGLEEQLRRRPLRVGLPVQADVRHPGVRVPQRSGRSCFWAQNRSCSLFIEQSFTILHYIVFFA
jgi:hypothetical protein